MPEPGSCSLHWTDHLTTVTGILHQMYQQSDFTDVTLVCEDVFIPAHSLVLSACSPFFSSLLKDQTISPITISIVNTNPSLLQFLMTLLYYGEVTITRDILDPLLATASQLQITCLTAESKKMPDQKHLDCFVDLDDLDELIEFYDNEIVFSSSDTAAAAVLDSQSIPEVDHPKLSYKENLMELIKTSLRKEEMEGKACWHCLCCDKRWVVVKKSAHRHMEKHLPTNECDGCSKTFSSREALKVHVKRNHKNYVDPDETVDCYSKAIEKDFVEEVKDDEKSYLDQMDRLTSYKMAKIESKDSTAWCCLVCGNSFKHKNTCRKHMQTHLVGLTLPCRECNKVFRSKRSLQRHLLRCQRKAQNKTEDTVVVVEKEVKG